MLSGDSFSPLEDAPASPPGTGSPSTLKRITVNNSNSNAPPSPGGAAAGGGGGGGVGAVESGRGNSLMVGIVSQVVGERQELVADLVGELSPVSEKNEII